jgi:hypothetical protein
MKLESVTDIQMGYSFRSRLEPDDDGDVAVIQMKDLLDDNTVSCENTIRVYMDSIKETHLVKKGDLVFRSRGNVSTTAILNENPGRAIIAAPLFRIRVTKKDKVLPEYLNWYISQRAAQKFLTSRAIGTSQVMISKDAVGEMDVEIPSLDRQKKIVELAWLMNRERDLVHKLVEKKEQYISSILTQHAKGESKS